MSKAHLVTHGGMMASHLITANSAAIGTQATAAMTMAAASPALPFVVGAGVVIGVAYLISKK
jgi:hypothetical protein